MVKGASQTGIGHIISPVPDTNLHIEVYLLFYLLRLTGKRIIIKAIGTDLHYFDVVVTVAAHRFFGENDSVARKNFCSIGGRIFQDRFRITCYAVPICGPNVTE